MVSSVSSLAGSRTSASFSALSVTSTFPNGYDPSIHWMQNRVSPREAFLMEPFRARVAFESRVPGSCQLPVVFRRIICCSRVVMLSMRVRKVESSSEKVEEMLGVGEVVPWEAVETEPGACGLDVGSWASGVEGEMGCEASDDAAAAKELSRFSHMRSLSTSMVLWHDRFLLLSSGLGVSPKTGARSLRGRLDSADGVVVLASSEASTGCDSRGQPLKSTGLGRGDAFGVRKRLSSGVAGTLKTPVGVGVGGTLFVARST